MDNGPSSEMREKFEKWANAKGTMGDSWNGEYYDNILHESAWQAWQAAVREAVSECAKFIEEQCPDVLGDSLAAALREKWGVE